MGKRGLDDDAERFTLSSSRRVERRMAMESTPTGMNSESFVHVVLFVHRVGTEVALRQIYDHFL